MEKVKLGEVFTIKKGKKAIESSSGKYNYITIENLHSKVYNLKTNDIGTEVSENDIIIAWDGANAGLVGTKFNGFIGSTLAQLKLNLNFKNKVETYYVYRFLDSKFEYIKSKRTGATIPHVNGIELKKIQIPLPDLATQKRIAAKLDKADELRQYNQQLIKKYDELTQSLFLDMFGDPVKNEKGWEVIKFGMTGKLDRGKSKHRPRNAPELLGGKYPLIQTGDVANSNGYVTKYHTTYSDFGLAQSKIWKSGTLCITIAANIAKTGILTFDACFPDSVVGFIPDKNFTNAIFTQHWMSFLQKILEDSAPESAQKNINLAILRNLNFPLPPISLQNEFASRVQAIEVQKALAEQALAKSEELFQSLLKASFS